MKVEVLVSVAICLAGCGGHVSVEGTSGASWEPGDAAVIGEDVVNEPPIMIDVQAHDAGEVVLIRIDEEFLIVIHGRASFGASGRRGS